MKKYLFILMTALLSLSCTSQAQEDNPVQQFINENNLSAELAEKLSAISIKVESYSAPLSALVQEYRSTEDAARRQAIEAEYDKLAAEMSVFIKQAIKDNRDNVIPAFFAPQLMYELSLDELKELCAEGTGYYNHSNMRMPKRLLEGLLKRAPGNKFVDLEESDLEGNTHKLSEYVGNGNYVLVDFWASWCAPCRAEMPNVKAAYEKYHSKGFNVVGLSFDNKKEAWEKAVKDMDLNWVHLSDLQGWQTVAAEVYGVSSIPACILVGSDGTIIAEGLRGKALGDKLAEIYGE